MKRKIAIIMCLAMLSLAACGKEKEPDIKIDLDSVTSVETVSDTTESESKDELVDEIISEVVENDIVDDSSVIYPVTITDQAGREVVIEKEPEKIVSGYYISSSLLIALELDDKMVGIEAKAGKRPIYKLAAKDLIDLPSVGSAKEFDLEGCAALEPDLVILPMKLKEQAGTLEGLGIQTVLVNPESEKLLVEMIDIISTATNTVSRGEMLKDCITANKEMLDEKLADVVKKEVYLAGNSSVLSTAGNKMYQCSVIELAGGENVAASIEDKYWVDVDYEQILEWNPEYIIIAAEAEYTVDDVLADPVLAECSAVQNGNVYKFPSDAEAWDSPVPSGILGSVWMASILHPDVISSEETDTFIEEFYETFYEFSYKEK